MPNATEPRWLDQVKLENGRFRKRIVSSQLPVQRAQSSIAVITCMDPRVNLAAIGIAPFGETGEAHSVIRVIRTIGAMADPRSLVIGVFLAGIRELAIVMHTDCGCCLAHSKIDLIADNLQKGLTAAQVQDFRKSIGEPFSDRLRLWLKAFQSPADAVKQEIAAIRAYPFVPQSIILHGLIYELATGHVEVVIDGYEESKRM